ncbi:MAG: hypothetical protein H2172_14275 [Opitutus sp.]|nr:hypothetical protein [Opitutus sp.]MCS6277555.1 hypothetical protein [Opitutus sp.]MCS6300673.1 hypothetical protein [Opitutus sp.]
MQIRSKLSALFESRENRTLRRETDLAKDESEESFANSVFDSDALFRDKTEKIEHESRSAMAERIDRFLDFVADDPLVHAMIILVLTCNNK